MATKKKSAAKTPAPIKITPASIGAKLSSKQALGVLASGCLEGTTPTLAKKLIDRFGPAVFEEILASDPEAKRLCGDRFDEIYAEIESKAETINVLSWMAENGATSWMANRAAEWSLDGENLAASGDADDFLERLKKDPHLLSDAPGIGFGKADEFALRVGIQPESPKRQLACVRAAVSEACDNAGGGARLHDIERKVQFFLTTNFAMSNQRASELSGGALQSARDEKMVKDALDEHGHPMIFSADYFAAEEACAHKLLKMTQDPSPYHGQDLAEATATAEKLSGLTLVPQQRDALSVLFQGRVAIIAGKPGAGKTTLLKCVAPLLEANGRTVHYAAPTGKAAKRMRQSLGGGRKTSTIHSLLGLGKSGSISEADGKDDKQNPLRQASAVVVDEASMIDTKLMLSILRSIGPKTLLVLVGDPGQLPSVRAGKVLADLIDSQAFPTAHLNGVLRQGANSDIIKVSRAIDEGHVPDFALGPNAPPERIKSDCLFLEEPDAANLATRLIALLNNAKNKGKMDPLRDAQVIVGSNIGAAGSHALNNALQEAFNPFKKGINQVECSRKVKGVSQPFYLRAGDKVMQTVNESKKEIFKDSNKASEILDEKGIFNGDVGFIESVDKYGAMWVKFDSGCVSFSQEEARKSLQLSYANTVHKFQGSESPLIFFALHHSTPKPLLTRNLVYTAITRAKERCFVIGSFRSLVLAAATDALSMRKTRLKGLLNGTITPQSAPADVLAIFEQKALNKTVEDALQKQVDEHEAALAQGELLPLGEPAAPQRRGKRL